MDAAFSIIAVVAGIIVVVAIVAVSVCGVQWGRVRRAEIEARLKQDMLARGLSVDDIERLLRASSQGRPSPPALTLTVAAAVESMAQADKDTQEIATVLDAFLRQQHEPPEASRQNSLALAVALESMAGVRDTEEMAEVIEAFLRRHELKENRKETAQV